MTDLEISKALAIAIGWPPRQIGEHEGTCYVNVSRVNDWRSDWKPFDYRYSSVIMPIAEKFDCFPFRHPFDREVWCARTAKNIGDSNVRADTPQKAIALAVIGAKK